MRSRHRLKHVASRASAIFARAAGQPPAIAWRCHDSSASNSTSFGQFASNAGTRGKVTHVISGINAGNTPGKSARLMFAATAASHVLASLHKAPGEAVRGESESNRDISKSLDDASD